MLTLSQLHVSEYFCVLGPNDTSDQIKRNSELIKIAFPHGHKKYGEAVFDPEMCGKWSVSGFLVCLSTYWKGLPGSVELVDCMAGGRKQQSSCFQQINETLGIFENMA